MIDEPEECAVVGAVHGLECRYCMNNDNMGNISYLARC